VNKLLLIVIAVLLLTACSSEESGLITDRYWWHVTTVWFESSTWECNDYLDPSTCGYESVDRERCRVQKMGRELPTSAAELSDSCYVQWGDWVTYRERYYITVKKSESNGIANWEMGNPVAQWSTLEPGKVIRAKIVWGEIQEIVSIK